MKQKTFIVFLALVCLAPSTASATTFTYNFAGTISFNFTYGSPDIVPPTATPYSGSITYHTVAGIPDARFAGTYDFNGAIDAFTFKVGAYSFSGSGGNIYSQGGVVDFESWLIYGDTFNNIGSIAPGFHVNALDLAVRGGPDLGSSFPSDLSGFSIAQSSADYDIFADNGSGRLSGSGPLSSLYQTPEPMTLPMILSGVLGLSGFCIKWKNKVVRMP